jgi:hypothetical protein
MPCGNYDSGSEVTAVYFLLIRAALCRLCILPPIIFIPIDKNLFD